MQAQAEICGSILVTWCIGLVVYELELPQTWKMHPIFHTSLLQPFQTTTWTRSKESAMDELEQEEDDGSYEVEKLL